MKLRHLAITGALLSAAALMPLRAADDAIRQDADDIAGIVRSEQGPEAGVWVIAETRDLPTRFVRIVVTDDRGRYLLPDLPSASYEVFVRGYGLVDSERVQAKPGQRLDLRATIAPSAREAAQYYPPDYWWALLELPGKDRFPGTGVGSGGNGIPRALRSRVDFIGQMKLECFGCHQTGNKATREFLPGSPHFDTSVLAWDHRIQVGQMGPGMSAVLGRYGRQVSLQMLASWTDRIAAGEIPPEAPPRPQGVERNVVISEWGWGDQYAFVHDTISTDKRRPTVNANGHVYGVARFRNPQLLVLDPKNHRSFGIDAQVRDADTPFTNPQTVNVPSPYWGTENVWNGKASLHNPMIDEAGRVWLTHQIRKPENPAFCRKGSTHPSAQMFPLDRNDESRQLSFYDPKSGKFTLIDTCFGTHHLQFMPDGMLWTSAGYPVIGWLDTKQFLRTGDAMASQGWTPFILDTNGNGRRDEGYVQPGENPDPKRDTRVFNASTYGLITNPRDGSVWAVEPGLPGALLRIMPGKDPSRTALTERYEPPYNDAASSVKGYSPRGIDIDRNGIIWTALAGSAHIASFDRGKCKMLNGPTATGQHCPEGWRLYPVPSPRYKNTDEAEGLKAGFLYYQWVDQFNALGLGANIPIATGTNNESLFALQPDSGNIVRLHVPYPMGFYHRGVDGRIDDPKAGWKGRGLWANFGNYLPWHYEGGKGSTSMAVHFQLRPDPLAR